ncbi:hypothetical protein B0H19DRAFT_1267531 [Mycena capillaripes]|nr:hypothetical protein B0H19DRAFT_1267531 [Mycena capillaripes]
MTTTCHRALQISEIVRMICEEAHTGLRPLYHPQKTLVSLARTSRIFSEPALDVLWHELMSLVPLVKCMPDTLWEERDSAGGLGGVAIHLRRPIASEDIPRLLFYSVRIRVLEIETTFTSGTIHHDFLRALDMSLPTEVLMPRLSQFSWTPRKNDPLSFMHHFLGRQTRKIELQLGDEIAGLSILPYIKSSCPFVSKFTLYTKTLDPFSVRIISDLLCGWHHLTELSISNLDKAGFSHVAQLHSLGSLNLNSVTGTPPFHPPEFLSGATFPALKNLSVCCETAQFCAGIVQVISCRQFENLSVFPLTIWTTSAWQELHTTLRDCLNNSTFCSMEVDESDQLTRPADTASFVLSSDALRPLLAFRNMTTVVYNIYPGLDADDDFLEQMALAWPYLDALQFSTDVLIT